MKPLLLVDDNDRYAAILSEYFGALGYAIDRAVDAAGGLRMFREHPNDHYAVIVTDITMESQLAGISMLGRMQKEGYPGTVVVASTGFDVRGVIPLSRLILRRYGVDYLVRKTTVLTRQLEFWPMTFRTPPSRTFAELTPKNA